MAMSDPTKMALQIAGLRANETHLPPDFRVFEDPYAAYFFDEETQTLFLDENRVKAELAGYEQMMPGVNGAIVARIRLFDDIVEKAAAAGTTQLVIIGAGYDTRAYRIDGVNDHFTVFEVDHPDTQQVKQDTIRRIFGTLPDHVVYVPVVFGKEPLDEKLMKSGYDPEARTLFILEGLLMYIPPPAVDGLLSFIVNRSGPGSALAADVFTRPVVDGTSPLPEARMLRAFVEKEGSMLQFGLDENGIASFFTDRQFAEVSHLTPEVVKEKFFEKDAQKRAVSPMFNFVHAVTRR